MKHLIVVNGNAGSYDPSFEEKVNEAFKGLDFEMQDHRSPQRHPLLEGIPQKVQRHRPHLCLRW